MTILFAILLFALLILVHELGHFLAAKAFGVQVNEFSLFMGPAIWKKQIGETLYSIRCIPFGGYCAMEGEDEGSDNPRAFTSAKWWKRLIILVAGAAMNLIMGFVLVAIALSLVKQPIPQIDYLRTGSTLAAEGGLQAGDRILELDGKTISSTNDFSAVLDADPSKTLYDVRIERNGQELFLEDVTMAPQEFPENEEGSAGIFYGIQWDTRNLNFGEILTSAWDNCVYYVEIVWMSLGMLVSGQVGLMEMSGPVGIVSMMNETAQAAASTLDAITNLLSMGALVAVNLGIMNLLPIPALDGCRAVCVVLTAAVEGITKKKLDPKYEGYVHTVGMILLLILIAVIMFKDIWALF